MGQYEDLFRKSIRHLDSRDEPSFRALLAPDVELRAPQGVYHGRDEVLGFFKTTDWQSFSTGNTDIVRLVETPTGIAAECRWRGVNDGPLATPMGEVPATGRPVDVTYAIWVDTEAGLARSIRVYFDGMEYAMQLGLMPEPQQA